jgi:hypothetical protein
MNLIFMDFLFRPYRLPGVSAVTTKRRQLSPTGPRSEDWGGARIAKKLFYINCGK